MQKNFYFLIWERKGEDTMTRQLMAFPSSAMESTTIK